MENLYLDNAIKHYKIIYLDNNSYHDKIMIGYYAYIFIGIYNYNYYAYICMFCVVYNSIRKFTIITIIKLLSLS